VKRESGKSLLSMVKTFHVFGIRERVSIRRVSELVESVFILEVWAERLGVMRIMITDNMNDMMGFENCRFNILVWLAIDQKYTKEKRDNPRGSSLITLNFSVPYVLGLL
jgi:hypothetical protein